MSESSASLRTKKALAAALKARMQTTPFTKISVSDLVNDCGLNRKTFYYHFTDIYALLHWLFEEEAIEVVRHFDLLSDYKECLDFALSYIDSNRTVLRSAYNSVGREMLKNFFYNDFHSIVEKLVTETERELGKKLDTQLKILCCDFFNEAIAGMVVNDIGGRYPQNRTALAEDIAILLRTSIVQIVQEKGV